MSGDWEFIFICLLIYIIYKLISNWKKSTKKGGLAKSQEAASNALETAGKGIDHVKSFTESLAYKAERKSMTSSLKKIKFTEIDYGVQARAMSSFYTVRYHPELTYTKFGPFPKERDENSWVFILYGFRKRSGKYNDPETIFEFKNDMLNSNELKNLCLDLNVSYVVFSENNFVDDFRHSVRLKEFEVFEVKKEGFVSTN